MSRGGLGCKGAWETFCARAPLHPPAPPLPCALAPLFLLAHHPGRDDAGLQGAKSLRGGQ